MPEMKKRAYRPWNPAIVGAIVGVIAALIVFGSDAAHTVRPDNPMLATPWTAGGTGFAMGMLFAMFRNWINDRQRP
jgi:hypothetical protein